MDLSQKKDMPMRLQKKASLFIAVQFALIGENALSALKDKGVLTVVLILHASNFPSNRATQMFISYQVCDHWLPAPYQIWGGTTVAEVLEMMKAKHIQGFMSKSVVLPSSQPLWGGFCTTGSSFGLPRKEKYCDIAVSPWST